MKLEQFNVQLIVTNINEGSLELEILLGRLMRVGCITKYGERGFYFPLRERGPVGMAMMDKSTRSRKRPRT